MGGHRHGDLVVDRRSSCCCRRLLGPAVRGLAWVLHRLGGFPLEIAERLVVRETGRSSLTIGVLFMAVAAGLGTSNAVLSITQDIYDWQRSDADRRFSAADDDAQHHADATPSPCPSRWKTRLKAIPGRDPGRFGASDDGRRRRAGVPAAGA